MTMSIEINGIAHIHITVNNLQRAIPFYENVLGFMGMVPAVKMDQGLYMIGGRTAIAITGSNKENRTSHFDQMRIGLHHVCFRAGSRDDIDKLYEYLKGIKASVLRPPETGPWAPGYYSMLFEDPDGIRLEMNYVPQEGLLAMADQFPLTSFPGYDDYPK